MSLEHIENYLKSIGDPALAKKAAALHKNVSEKHNITDIPLPTRGSQQEVKSTLQEYQNAWENNALTPELVDKTWRTFWQTTTEKAGVEPLNVPVCDRTAEELVALKKQHREALLLPDELMNTDGLSHLKVLFPHMTSNLMKTTIMNNESKKGGCIDVEMDKIASYKNTTVPELETIFSAKGLSGQRVQTYIVASNWSKLLRGYYFEESDERSFQTYARLIGSTTSQKRSALGGMKRDGISIASDYGKYSAEKNIGGRSEGRKRVFGVLILPFK